jgi:chromosome segregation ATPase
MSPLEGSPSGTGVLDDVEAAELILWLAQSHDRNKCKELFERFQSDMKDKDLQISGLMDECARIKGEVGVLESGISILRNGNEVLKSSNEVLRIQTKDQEIKLYNYKKDLEQEQHQLQGAKEELILMRNQIKDLNANNVGKPME